MLSPHPSAGSPQDWLRYVQSDLELAQFGHSPRILLEAWCFHAQQAAEKSIKAVLITQNVPFPRTHSIDVLLNLLPSHLPVPDVVQEARSLTDYAVMSRYPGNLEEVLEDEYQEAIRLATAVVEWANTIIQAVDLMGDTRVNDYSLATPEDSKTEDTTASDHSVAITEDYKACDERNKGL